jgi:SulP family sulfate permease
MFKGYFTLKNFRGDFFGGITAGIVALPLALAFGEQSGLGAAAGLFGAIFIGFFASLFCSTQPQISGPTAPMTAVSVVVIAQVIQSFNGNVAQAMPSILLVFFLAGVLQIILGLIGVGKYIKYIPYPVISGFMTGIGVIILMTQIFPLLGYVASEDPVMIQKNRVKAESKIMSSIFQEVKSGQAISLQDLDQVEQKIRNVKNITEAEIIKEAKAISATQVKSPMGIIKNIDKGIKNINWLEFAIVVSTVIVIYGFKWVIGFLPSKIPFFNGLKKISSSIPSTLVALVLVTSVAVLLKLDLKTIENIPLGFPSFHPEVFTNFSFSTINPLLIAVFSLAMLGSIDSLLTSVIVDNRLKTRHNSSQELISQGVGNSMASLFGGIPGASATIRTLLNMNTGGRTRLSGIFAALLLLSILLFLAPVASMIPSAVLAGVLITVGIGILDYRGLKTITKMPKGDVAVMFIVMLLTIFWDLVIAVGIGLIISALIFMKKMGQLSADRSKLVSLDQFSELPWTDELSYPVSMRKKVYVKHLVGPIFFGYTNDLQLLYTQIPDHMQYIILRMDKVPYIDQSGLYALEDIFSDLKKKNKTLLIVGLQKQPKYLIEKIDIIPILIPQEHCFKTFDDCISWLKINAAIELNEESVARD